MGRFSDTKNGSIKKQTTETTRDFCVGFKSSFLCVPQFFLDPSRFSERRAA